MIGEYFSSFETLAAATVIPCLARLDEEAGDPPEFMTPLPKLHDCAVIKIYADMGKF